MNQSQIESYGNLNRLPSIPGVLNIIAIASGKGGVGKSTTAVNLAVLLAEEGARIGLFDADIYGPSLPQLLGTFDRPQANENDKPLPILKYGIQCMSLGFLVGPHTPAIWRGPMASKAVEQLLEDTAWDSVDYLIIDLPPGTGDIHLTLAQKIPLSGVVIVTTPEPLAFHIARKGLEMFRKVKVPILGIIENMSFYQCNHCGHREHLLGEGGGSILAQETDTELLGQLPFDSLIHQNADQGKPIVIAEPKGTLAEAYRKIAKKITMSLSQLPKNYTHKFPKIAVEPNVS